MRFDDDGPVVLPSSQPVDFVQKDGLADTAQAGEQDTFLRPLRLYATKKDTRLLKNTIATNEFRRR
ncbi:MAG: hypothetical protein Q8J74_04035 [Candidatus Didemnitutus sp.]|nr:hypothetical protein [Candidatus Didemnitutus sp.]